MRRFALLIAFIVALITARSAANAAHDERACQRPYPVVLLHETFRTAEDTWLPLMAYLERSGFCVFPLNYGDVGWAFGIAPVESSAYELAEHVDRILERTGAEKVSIVGHGQGGLMPRWYLRFLDGAAKVDELIALGPANHGTDTHVRQLLCPACIDQMTGSLLLTTLNDGHEVESDVDYTTIFSRYDEVSGSALTGPASHVSNIELQHRCPFNFSGHASLPKDPVVWQWTLHALLLPGPASLRFRPLCLS